MVTQIFWIAGGAGLLALVYAAIASGRINAFEVTNERIVELSGIIQRGSMAFLSREYRALVPFVLAVGALLWFKISPYTAMSFLFGALCSGF
ncbi:MAG: sodium/proton-translocating pyrophosphatase, partial [Thermovirgaceae bacterium]|nr:sodium/proton-translocating pyrophosphatase [Thermovirgaceae bacterium]